ncbi:MAG: lysoplasmalogenase, partial [Bacteroidetes bacterium]|nr:lysoplasmalogenase [Bacteroidota bacterium]
ILFHKEELRLVTKPLIVILLLLFTWRSVAEKNKLFRLLITALFFSWLGDVFLLFDVAIASLFIFGLLSFLIAHIFFVLFFLCVRRQNQVQKIHWFIITLVVIYLMALFWILNPTLGALQIPVLVYAIVLCSMFLSSIHAFNSAKDISGKYCVAGAFLFLLSDSMLAVNKFYHAFAAAGFAVMLTYALAQLFIVTGATRFLNYEHA